MHKLTEIKQLGIWNYLGDQLQATLTSDFEQLSESDQEAIFDSLNQLEQVHSEMATTDAGKASFAIVLQKALINVMDDLIREVKDLRQKHFDLKENSQNSADQAAANDLLSQM